MGIETDPITGLQVESSPVDQATQGFETDPETGLTVRSNSNMGKSASNPNVGGTPVNTANDKYNEAQHVDNGSGSEAVSTARQNFAPNSFKPTSASDDPGKDLVETLKKVDPNGAAQFLKGLIKSLALANNTMSMTTPSKINDGMIDSLANALAQLSKKYGFSKVVNIFNNLLDNNGIQNINPLYQPLVKDALAKLIQNAAKNGENKLVFPVVPPVVPPNPKAKVPSPIVTIIPNLYIQQYYDSTQDPYVGYVQWLGQDGTSVYTLRTTEYPPYKSAKEAISIKAQVQLASELDPYILNNNLTASVLNAILDKIIVATKKNGLENSLGKNSSANLMSLLNLLLGTLGKVVNQTTASHLPQSVLDQSSVGKSMEKFSKNMGIVKKMKSDTEGAFKLPSAVSALAGSNAIPVIGAALGAKGSTIQTVASVSNLIKKLV